MEIKSNDEPQDVFEYAMYGFRLVGLFFEQVALMCLKNINQKQRNSRQFWKDTFMIQFFLLSFTTYIIYASNVQTPTAEVYQKFPLPPLSKDSTWGIFNQKSNGNNIYTVISKRLYYSPNNHAGINSLIDSLVATYPDIEAVGTADSAGINDLYETNLFDTWATIEFTLTDEQKSTGKLITSETSTSVVSYVISVNPTNYGNGYPTFNQTDNVYNKLLSDADLFWNTGYLTLQNYIASYLSAQYDSVPDNYKIEANIQRFPKSPIYDDTVVVNIDSIRNQIWKWLGATILAICLFVPVLSYLTEIVRERQFLMKDLLEISGLMNPSYWFSYLLMCFANGVVAMWICIGLLAAYGIFDMSRVLAYSRLMLCYILGSSTFGMAFGFVVPRSEYYGLPIFVLTIALTICGAYLGIDYDISSGLKLFFCFLSPSIGLTMGILSIETYMYHNDNARMDYDYIDADKAYPSLNQINMVLLLSALMYFLITVSLPLDWLLKLTSSTAAENLAANRQEDMKYPCDNEEEELTKSLANVDQSNPRYLLNVQALSQVYPDGTNAVKDMNFRVKEGEVLSFLGANGAGKSTCMKMLCGTLDATNGDALVNGYSISTQRTLARRNLGIAMQQDIIWDDINVEDHLMLFGRLRGLHGVKLREAVAQMIESVGFPDKRKALAGTLSGGQKRRLCVALSMVGGNPVVYLDEPTAGLDPVSRRQLWELVERNREGRAILLTTHFMDEADVLGDRIAVVKEGRLRALGTAKFLKQRFGLGYLLRMSLKEGANPEKIRNVVEQFIPQTTIASSAGTELSLRLPRETVHIFPKVFERIESDSAGLGIASYGIETTTLEEVFMRIVNEDNEELMLNHQKSNQMLTASPEERDAHAKALKARDDERFPLNNDLINALLIRGRNTTGVTGWFDFAPLYIQTMVMFRKRVFQFVRSRGQWSMGFGIPLVIAILVGVLLSSMPTDLLGSTNDPVFPSYSTNTLTYTTGPTSAQTLSYTSAAGIGNTKYLGNMYQTLYNTIYNVANEVPGSGNSTYNGLAYDSLSNFTVMFNASYPMNFAAAMQDLTNAAVQDVTNNKLVLNTGYNSLPINRMGVQLNNGFFIALLISLAAGSFGAGLSIVVSGERVALVKHQQLASGASSVAYWLGNFLFDFLVMFFFVLLFGTVLAIFNPHTYTNDGFGYVIGAGFFCIIGSIFRFYSVSYLISDIKLAQSLYFYGTIAVVFVLIDIWFTLLFATAKGNINNPGVQALGYVFTVLDPTFGWYLIVLYQNNFLGILDQNSGSSFWSTKIAGVNLIMMVIGAGLYAAIFVFGTENALYGAWRGCLNSCSSNVVDGNGNKIVTRQSIIPMDGDAAQAHTTTNRLVRVPTPKEQKRAQGKDRNVVQKERTPGCRDPDVLEETDFVQQIVERGVMDPTESAIFIANVRKVYLARGNVPAKVAVKNVSVSIPQGEIFGLLGANGAGKTTLLKMVSGLEQPTSGMALINGYDVVHNTNQAQRSMGLCPQFDTLIERLTVRENLLFFGKIKGLTNEENIQVTEAFMQAMNIKRYQNKLIQQLSGGNRRKVSLAVALMGAPPTVYLDEPSTGLDPVASRLMWRLLSKIASAKTAAIVLTTHNMLECEAVCTRVSIMKLGEMVCLGNTQHLRSAHGTGFQLEVNLLDPSANEKVKQFVSEQFAGAVLIEEHATLLNYEIPRTSITQLSQAFRVLEDNKTKLQIDDYCLSQSTLEQVFLKQIRPNENDARNQEDQQSIQNRVPLFRDYVMGYTMWALAGFFPGLHHFYLGNFWRGMKYLFTGNEVYAGWVLDLLEMHILIQKSVQEYGNVAGMCYCQCCVTNATFRACCCCCCASRGRTGTVTHEHNGQSMANLENVA